MSGFSCDTMDPPVQESFEVPKMTFIQDNLYYYPDKIIRRKL